MLDPRLDVTVIENTLDERIWTVRRRPGPVYDEPVRILAMGTASHDADFELIRPALDRLKREYGGMISVDILGMTNRALPEGLNRIGPSLHGHRSYPAFVNWLCSVDPPWHIGLAPLLDTPFNRCKSSLKALDYAALGIAVLASDVPVYRDLDRQRASRMPGGERPPSLVCTVGLADAGPCRTTPADTWRPSGFSRQRHDCGTIRGATACVGPGNGAAAADRECRLKMPERAPLRITPSRKSREVSASLAGQPEQLVDPAWYSANHSDVTAAGIAPVGHYVADGLREGRYPNAWFDASWYARQPIPMLPPAASIRSPIICASGPLGCTIPAQGLMPPIMPKPIPRQRPIRCCIIAEPVIVAATSWSGRRPPRTICHPWTTRSLLPLRSRSTSSSRRHRTAQRRDDASARRCRSLHDVAAASSLSSTGQSRRTCSGGWTPSTGPAHSRCSVRTGAATTLPRSMQRSRPPAHTTSSCWTVPQNFPTAGSCVSPLRLTPKRGSPPSRR